MRELALFAGAGGGILGGKLLGWRCVCAVEIDPYARNRLLDRQADGCLERFPVWDDVTTFDGTVWRGHIDVVSGGFPCQDISAAGKGAGVRGGQRSGLWTEYARIVGEVQPRFVWVENSPMLTLRGLDVVLGDLSALGYDAVWGVVSAADVGAPHLRERIWILGHATSERVQRNWSSWVEESHAHAREGIPVRSSGAIHDTNAEGGALADAAGRESGEPTEPQGREDPLGGSQEINGHDTDAAGGGLAELRGSPWNPGHADRVHEDVADTEGECGGAGSGKTGKRRRRGGPADCGGAGQEMGDSSGLGRDARRDDDGEHDGAEPGAAGEHVEGHWWAAEPDVGRASHGLA